MRPRLLNRYIGREFTVTVLLILAAVGTVFLLGDYVEVLRRYGEDTGFTPLLGVRLALMRLPYLLDTVLPFALLFGALLSLLSLSRKLELVVARASGVSVWGFLRAPLVVAMIIGALASGLLNPLAVNLKNKAENIEAELKGSAARRDPGHWFRQDSPAGPSIVYSGSVSNDGLALFGVTAFVFDSGGKFRAKVTARRADYTPNRWHFTDAEVVSAETAPRRVATYELPTELTAEELQRTVVQPEAVSLWSLPGFIDTAARTGLDPNRYRLAFHALVSRPLFLLAMVAIAATVSLRLTRFGGTWKLIFAGVSAGFLLYVLTEVAGDLGGNGIINPVLAAWLPAIVALTFGATALLYQEDG
jgi:lipopolysaccharide export system permease protein